MSFRLSHCGDVHLDEDRYFGDTAQCLEWFVYDGSHHKIQRWIANGLLRDRPQGTRRHDGNGRDVHRIQEKDILKFHVTLPVILPGPGTISLPRVLAKSSILNTACASRIAVREA